MVLDLIKEIFSKTSMEKLSAIATAIAAFFAWRTTSMNKKQIKEQNEEQHRVERPRLVPLNKEVFIDLRHPSPHLPWNTSDPLYDEDTYRYNELDDFYFTLINTGQSFALKIELTFELIGGIDSINEINEGDYSLVIDNPEVKQLNPKLFTFTLRTHESDERLSSYQQYVIDHFERRFPLLKSNESSLIRVPKYFVKLNNLNMIKITNSKPQLKLKINYVNQYHEKHTDSYIMQLKKNPLFNTENINDDINEFYLDFEYIKFDLN